jgi:hypothetical protein
MSIWSDYCKCNNHIQLLVLRVYATASCLYSTVMDQGIAKGGALFCSYY